MKTLRFLSFIFIFSSFCLNAQKIKIGDLYTFDDNTKGVVFYVDEEGHVKKKEDGKKKHTMSIVRISQVSSTSKSLISSLTMD